MLYSMKREYIWGVRSNSEKCVLFRAKICRKHKKEYYIHIPSVVVNYLRLRADDKVKLYLIDIPKRIMREVRIYCKDMLISRAVDDGKRIVVESLEGKHEERVDRLKERVITQLLVGLPEQCRANLTASTAYISCLVNLLNLEESRKLTKRGVANLGPLVRHLSKTLLNALGLKPISVRIWNCWRGVILEEEVPLVEGVVTGKAYYCYHRSRRRWEWWIQINKSEAERLGYIPRRAIIALKHDNHFEVLRMRALSISKDGKVTFPIPKLVATHIGLKHKDTVEVAFLKRKDIKCIKRKIRFFPYRVNVEFYTEDSKGEVFVYLKVSNTVVPCPVSESTITDELLPRAYYDGLTSFTKFISLMTAIHAIVIKLEEKGGEPLGWRSLGGPRELRTLEGILSRLSKSLYEK